MIKIFTKIIFNIATVVFILTAPVFLAWAVYTRFIYPIGQVQISGTGSMYPTFPKGSSENVLEQTKEIVSTPKVLLYPNGLNILGNNYFKHQIARGDIVSFENTSTKALAKDISSENMGFVKRVIGLPGETVELRDGVVYINSTPLLEPYTAHAHSTFGGSFLPECQKLEIPEGQLLVLGDNRKESDDSRHSLGLISYGDIDGVITSKMQKGVWDVTWRDISKDLEQSSKIKLDIEKFILLINDKRAKFGASDLKNTTLLQSSSKKRGESILRFNDFSFDAPKSKYTMKDSLDDVGYFNSTWGEIPIQGYYDEVELANNLFQFTESRNFILNKEFDDIGVSVVEGDLNGCPAQVITIHLAGYIPATYSSDVISSWEDLLEALRDIQPGWEDIKATSKEAKRINEIIDIRIHNVSGIVDSMKKNLWLTPEQERYIDEDVKLADEQDELAKKLNDH